MRIQKSFFLSLLFGMIQTNAYAGIECINYDFLKKGFDFDAYTSCKASVDYCPAVEGLPEISCAQNIFDTHQSCQQLSQLANALHTHPRTLSVEAKGQYSIVDQYFSGDGVDHYFIISPAACIVDTNVDPRQLDNTLKTQFKNMEVLTTNYSPLTVNSENGQQSFSSVIQMTKSCLACEVLGYATVAFVFDKTGKLLKTSVIHFQKQAP